jgi:hypothetical protein
MKLEPKAKLAGEAPISALLEMAWEKALNGSPLVLRMKEKPQECLGDKLVRMTKEAA